MFGVASAIRSIRGKDMFGDPTVAGSLNVVRQEVSRRIGDC